MFLYNFLFCSDSLDFFRGTVVIREFIARLKGLSKTAVHVIKSIRPRMTAGHMT